MTRLTLCLISLLIASCGSSPRSPGSVPDAATDATVDASLDALSDSALDGSSPDAGGPGAPTVRAEETYEIMRSTHVYAQGLTHERWGGAESEAMDLELDLYLPQGAPDNRPALVLIHGGGFTGGSRAQDQIVTYAEHFASRGWVCISVDYRLARNRGTVPEEWSDYVRDNVPMERRNQALALYPAARDSRAAIRWLHSRAGMYQINPDYVSVMGGSAGAALAIMAGITEPEDYRDELSMEEDPTLASTNPTASSRVVAILDYWGGATLVTSLDRIYGRDRFDATDAPVNIVHGTADPTVDFSEAEFLRDAYMRTGVSYAFEPLEGAGHGPWGARIDGQSLPENGFDFLTAQIGLTVE